MRPWPWIGSGAPHARDGHTGGHWVISHPPNQNTLTAVRDDADKAVAETDGGEGARYVFVHRAANATRVPRAP